MNTFLCEFLKEAHRRNPLLYNLSMVLFLFFSLFIISFGLCGNPPVSEVCYWLKPFKFSASFALYLLTLAWLLEYLKPSLGERKIRSVSHWIAGLIIIEMAAILFQSLQHSRIFGALHLSEPAMQSIASVLHFIANAAILLNVAVFAYIMIHFFSKFNTLSSSYLWGIRAGILLMVYSCGLGVYLLYHYGQVPPSKVNYGMPFTQFSSTRSNLISLHFLGIHAIQIFPVFGYYVKERLAHTLIFLTTGFYLAITLYFLIKLIA